MVICKYSFRSNVTRTQGVYALECVRHFQERLQLIKLVFGAVSALAKQNS